MSAAYFDPWSSLRYEPEPSPADDPNLLWFNSNVNPDDVLEASEHRTQFEYTVDGKKRVKPGSKQTVVGTKVVVNGKVIGIFKHFGRLYAINNVCPHQRGELHLGDIEEIDKTPCVSCPRHHWPFSLKDGSCSVGARFQAEVYPVKIDRLRDGRDVIFLLQASEGSRSSEMGLTISKKGNPQSAPPAPAILLQTETGVIVRTNATATGKPEYQFNPRYVPADTVGALPRDGSSHVLGVTRGARNDGVKEKLVYVKRPPRVVSVGN